MIKGHMLSFSIGGEVLAKKLICNGVKCFQKITFLDLHEVSACEQGVNPEAKSFVLKGDESHTLLSECKDGAELLSRLRNY
jgi:hypothetical protein